MLNTHVRDRSEGIGRQRGLATLALCGLFCSWQLANAEAAPANKASKLLPSDTQSLLAVDLESLRQSRYWGTLQTLLGGHEALKEATSQAKALGIDSLDALDSLVVAFPNGFDAKDDAIFVLEGAQLFAKIEQLLVKNGLPSKGSRHSGTAYRLAGEFAFARIGGAVVVAPEPLLKTVIDVQGKPRRSLAATKHFRSAVTGIDLDADVWVMSGGPKGLGVGSSAPDQLKGIALSLSMRSGIAIKASARLSDAAEVADAISKLEAMRASLVINPTVMAMGLAVVIQRTQLAQDRSRFNLSVSVTHEELSAMAPLWMLIKSQF